MFEAIAVPVVESKKSKRESSVVAEVLRYLESRPDVFAWRNNTGGAYRPGSRVPIRFGLRGSGDILGLIAGGRFLAVECKRPVGGRQSPDQRAFQVRVEALGGLYVLARDVGDVATALGPVRCPNFGHVVTRGYVTD